MDNNKIIEDLKKFAKTSNSFYGNALQRMRSDLEFVGGKQFDETDRKSRGKGRAELTFNLVRNYCNQITNQFRRKPYGIVVSPRKSDAKDKAVICQSLIRGWESKNSSVDKLVDAIDSQVKCGVGYVVLSNDYIDGEGWDQDIKIDSVLRPDMVIYDVYSKDVDGGDALETAFVEHISYGKAAELMGKDVDDIKYITSPLEGTLWQAPPESIELITYFKLKKSKSRVYRDDEGNTITEKELGKRKKPDTSRDIIKTTVCVYKVIGDEVIADTELPLTRLPIVPFRGEKIFRDGKLDWVGLVYYSKDPARLVNWTASLTAERIALSPKSTIFADFRSIAQYKDIWQQANRLNVPFLPYDSTSPDGKQTFVKPEYATAQVDITTPSAAQGNYQQMLSSILGMNENGAVSAGADNETATAIITRQRSSEVNNYQYMDNASKSIKAIGRVLIEMMNIIYDTPRILPMVNPEDKSLMMDEVDVQQLDIIPSELEVDVDAGPMLATQRKEELSDLVALGSLLGPEATLVFADNIADAMDNQNSDVIKAKLKAYATSKGIPDIDAPATPAVDQATQQQMQQLQQQVEQSNLYIQQLQGELQSQKSLADAQIATAQIKANNAIQVAAMKIQGDMNKEQMKIVADADQNERDAIRDQQKAQNDIANKPIIVVNGERPDYTPIDGMRNDIYK